MRSSTMIMQFVLVIASGCGTVRNLTSYDVPDVPGQSSFQPGHHPAPNEVFGGAEIDLRSARGLIEQSARGLIEQSAAGEPVDTIVGLYVLLIDLPLSAVADCLTLPVTIPAALLRRERERNESAAAPEEQSEEQPEDAEDTSDPLDDWLHEDMSHDEVATVLGPLRGGRMFGTMRWTAWIGRSETLPGHTIHLRFESNADASPRLSSWCSLPDAAVESPSE